MCIAAKVGFTFSEMREMQEPIKPFLVKTAYDCGGIWSVPQGYGRLTFTCMTQEIVRCKRTKGEVFIEGGNIVAIFTAYGVFIWGEDIFNLSSGWKKKWNDFPSNSFISAQWELFYI